MKKRISCIQCRKRKIRCDLKVPCSSCRKKEIDCAYPQLDARTLRTSAREVNHYKVSLQRLQNDLRVIKSLRNEPEQLQKFLDELKFDQLCDTEAFASDLEKISIEKTLTPTVRVSTDYASKMVLGPTSIYKQLDSLSPLEYDSVACPEDIGYGEMANSGSPLYPFNPFPESNFDSNLYAAITSFFSWQYPSIFLFIHRESFLFFFLQMDYRNAFLSNELMFAVASIGSANSSNETLRLLAPSYESQARSLIMVGASSPGLVNLERSSLTRLQTFLCLALTDLRKGKLTSCWLLSGIAFRMCSDLGLEWDPTKWAEESAVSRSQKYPFKMVEVKRRVFWGCYITDHFISLILGKLPTLRRKEVDVLDSSDLGDLANVEHFIYLDPISNSRYSVDAAICTFELVKLIEIGESMLIDVFGPKRRVGKALKDHNFEILRRLEKLDIYNKHLTNWKSSLSEKIAWNESSLLKNGYNYIALAPRSYYFLLRLSLNRPFMCLKSSSYGPFVRSIHLGEESVTQLEMVIRSIDKVHGIEKFRPIMPLVYAMVLATSLLAWKYSTMDDSDSKVKVRSSLDLFMKYLRICALTYTIAEEVISMVEDLFSRKDGINDNNLPWENCQAQHEDGEAHKSEGPTSTVDSFFDGILLDSAFRPNPAVLDWTLDIFEGIQLN